MLSFFIILALQSFQNLPSKQMHLIEIEIIFGQQCIHHCFPIGCAFFQFHCEMEDKCIPGNFRCDGYQDCASDESGCGEYH